MGLDNPTIRINGVDATFKLDGDGAQALTESVSTQDGFSATAVLKCAWNQRIQLMTGLLGSVTAVGNKIIRTPPFAYPPFPRICCNGIGRVQGIKPRVNRTLNWLEYDTCVMEVNFGFPVWSFGGESQGGEGVEDPSGIPYTVTKFRTSSEIFSPPKSCYYFPSLGGKPIDDSTVGIVRSRLEVNMTRHQIPYPPVWLLGFYESTVNNAPIRFADYVFPAGCVMFVGASTDPSTDPTTGTLTQTVELTFIADYAIPWNAFLAPDGVYRTINTRPDGSGQPPFQSRDFSVFYANDLFNPG